MRAVSNTILATLIVSLFIMTFTNFILFFPWYFTLVYETFNLSIQSSNENKITKDMLDQVRYDLQDRPLYRDYNNKIKIYQDEIVVTQGTSEKQRGDTYDIAIEAPFPFSVKALGTTFTRTLDVRFTIPVTGTKFYKNLDPLNTEEVY